MHKQLSVQLTSNSKFLSKFSRKPLSGISDQKAPPMKNFRFEMTKVYSRISPHKMKNFRFEMTKVYSRISPPPKWKTSDLRWPKFTPEYTPPKMKNFRFEMTKVYSGIPLPPNEKLQIWDDQSLLRNTPPPPPEGLESGRSYVETNLYPPWIPLVELVTPKLCECWNCSRWSNAYCYI